MSGPSRFLTTNYGAKRALVAGGSVLQNGTGGGAPALVQDASYPMANVMEDDREILWGTGAAPGTPVYVDRTLLASTSINCIGVCALRPASAVSAIDFYTQTGAYVPAGTWTLRGTVNNPGRDCGAVFAAVNVDSVRVRFTCSAQFQAGKLPLGLAWHIGANYVSDAGTREDTPVESATSYTLRSGARFRFVTGDSGRRINLELGHLTAAERTLAHGLVGLPRGFLHIDTEDVFHDCLLSGDLRTMQTAPNPLYSVTIPLVGLP